MVEGTEVWTVVVPAGFGNGGWTGCFFTTEEARQHSGHRAGDLIRRPYKDVPVLRIICQNNRIYTETIPNIWRLLV